MIVTMPPILFFLTIIDNIILRLTFLIFCFTEIFKKENGKGGQNKNKSLDFVKMKKKIFGW